MKYYIILLSLLLVSCNGFKLNSNTVASNYNPEDKSIQLFDKDISGFVNLNGLSGTGEVASIMIYGNTIEKLDVSEYSDLTRLNVSDNKIIFFSDLKIPTNIQHLILSDNMLQSLEGISSLTSLKTLDIRNNKLDKQDLKALSGMSHLELILIDGNSEISEDIQKQFDNFNQKYISKIKNIQDLDPNKHSFFQ